MKWLIKYLKDGELKEGTVEAKTLKKAIDLGSKKGKLVRRPKPKVTEK